MEKRTSPVVCLALAALFWSLPVARAQETITNVQDFAAVLDQSGCLYPLELPYEWEGMRFQPQDEWFLDFSSLTDAVAAVTNYPSENHGGVDAWPLRAIQSAETGEVVLKYVGASTNVTLLQIAAPPDYVPLAHYDDVLGAWCMMFTAEPRTTPYTDLIADGYTFLDPPVVTMDAWAMSTADEDAYYINGTPEAVSTGNFVALDEEDDGSDPCPITNLLQSFLVTGITATTNHAISISFQSCQVFRYLISYANALTNNESWIPLAYVWGATNVSSTTWADLSTTNNDGNTVTQRFYRVQRLLGASMAAGGSHSLAVTPDGKLWGWGYNSDGELGDNIDPYNNPEPTRAYPGEVADPTVCTGQTISNAVALAAGGDEFTVAVDASGAVWTCGDNDWGELGWGSAQVDEGTPSPVIGISNVVSVAAGAFHTLALRADMTVLAWGLDADGQLGVGGLPYPSYTISPTQSLMTAPIVAVAAGSYHSVALDVTGRVWTWGQGDAGQLGNGVATNVTIPTMVGTISNVIAVAAGAQHTIALTADKTVWAWGTNSFGQLGDGSTITRLAPVRVTNLSNVVAIAGGPYFSLAATSNGMVYGWGDNGAGQLGTNNASLSFTNNPIRVDGLTNAVFVSAPVSPCTPEYGCADGKHSMAMTVDGGTNHYWGWGYNYHGEVGNGTNSYNSGGNDNQYTPAQPQFCTRCQREVQLGTSGILTAQCNGTLYLYFNNDAYDGGYGFSSNQYAVAISGIIGFSQTNVPARAADGIAAGAVTNGGIYTYSATGLCYSCSISTNCWTDADGMHDGSLGDCSSINITNLVCPAARCFSLVGKIQ